MKSALMCHQHQPFLEPSAVRNLERVFKGYTSHKELQGYSSTPKQLRTRAAVPRHGAGLDEVALELGVTAERVRQIEKQAQQKCRKWCRENGYKLEDLLRV